MDIRRCNTSDTEEVTRIARDFLDYSPFCGLSEVSADAVQSLLAQQGAVVFWIAEEDAVTLGLCAAVVFPLWYADGALVTQELFWWVEPGARTSKCGKRLLSAMEDWSKDLGAKGHFMACLENAQTDRIKALYNRAGYKPVERTFFKRGEE